MPRPSNRTKSWRKRLRRLPSGKLKRIYKAKKVGVVHCASCGGQLFGFPRFTSSKLRKTSATGRKIGRVYGGQMCSTCLKEMLKQSARHA